MTPSKSHILQIQTSLITYSNFRFRLRPICRGRPVEVVENVHTMYRQIYGGFVSIYMHFAKYMNELKTCRGP